MERAVAVKKLVKLLGKKFGYRIDNKAASREEREAAQEALKPAWAKRDALRDQKDARYRAILAADAEYQPGSTRRVRPIELDHAPLQDHRRHMRQRESLT